MTPFLLPQRNTWLVISFASFCFCFACHLSHAAQWSEALQILSRADAKSASQAEVQGAWQAVSAEGTVERIPEILAAMRDVGPLAENWLRTAVDSIAEREFRKSGSLPSELFEKFTLDLQQAPRARRLAYEWLAKADATAPERLLPGMLDDHSLELRYDAISRLLHEAKEADDDQLKLQKYQRALRSARDKAQLKECAEALTKLGETPNMAVEMGFQTKWQVIGPFDNSDRSGFEKIYPPQQEIDLAGEYSGKNGIVKWMAVVAEQEVLDSLGIVDLNAALVEEKSVLAYAFTTFVAAKDQEVELRYESREATKLWVNGEEVASHNIYHSGEGFDQYIVPCQLKSGPNCILIKVCQNEQTQPWTKPWDFRLRITDNLGGSIHQVK